MPPTVELRTGKDKELGEKANEETLLYCKIKMISAPQRRDKEKKKRCHMKLQSPHDGGVSAAAICYRLWHTLDF